MVSAISTPLVGRFLFDGIQLDQPCIHDVSHASMMSAVSPPLVGRFLFDGIQRPGDIPFLRLEIVGLGAKDPSWCGEGF